MTMEKSRSCKKTAKIILTNRVSPASWKTSSSSSRKHNVRLDHDQISNAYHDLAMDEATNRDLRASSSSSLSLSFFSESDLAEAPSTSGCSSEMASVMRSKERKKEKAKEFMKKLKSMLPVKERMIKMDTLSTLEQVVNNMKRLSEGQRKEEKFKTPLVYTGTFHSMDADKLLQSDMFISVSLKNHIVQTASQALMTQLGYPADWWKGRLLRDFLSKNDANTVNGCLAQYSKEEHEPSKVAGEDNTSVTSSLSNPKDGTKCFFARIRRFRKLTESFSIQNVVSYSPFVMTVKTPKPSDATAGEDDKDASKPRKSLFIYCRPVTSAYTDQESLPTDRHFSVRHCSSCKYTDVEPSAIPLLGHLPQDFNGRSIFDFYHPDDYQKLLDIHKKIIQSMGQPFKTDSIRLKTRNGCYVELETEWSSFINPWSMKLEFIIGQHTVIKGPSLCDVFTARRSIETGDLSAELRKTQEKIVEVLQKPIQDVFTQPAPRPPVKDLALTAQKRSSSQMSTSDTSIVKPVKEKPKVHFQAQDIGEKYTVLDEKGISSIYNQLSYSYSIKRFLLSHPKPFSNSSDEDSTPARLASEDDPMHGDEEMPLEIPVVKPSSCGSSTQVHVSEQGHGEEMMSPPVFGDESVGQAAMMVPQKEVTSGNIRVLTEESLKKHTKIQELLYLQKIAEDQPLMLNMRRIKGCQNSPQKRPWPREPNEVEEKAKHPCPVSGVFRSSSNIFMQSFPSVSTCNLTPSTTPNQLFCQSNMVIPFNAQGMIYSQPQGLSATLPMVSPSIPLMAVRPTVTTVVPTNLQAMAASVGGGPQPIMTGLQPQNIQWPYYPQPGYTLLPQVMGGFYRPLLQPVSVETPRPGVSKPETVAQTVTAAGLNKLNMPMKKDNTPEFEVRRPEPDNIYSDTGSSIVYLLEADSSMYEDSDSKKVTGGTDFPLSPTQGRKHKRCAEPPWLRGVKWNTNTKMRYQVPQARLKPALKKDAKMLKKMQQGDPALESLEQLLEEISLPTNDDACDEEMDFLFYPNMKNDERHMMEDKFMEVMVNSPLEEQHEEEEGRKVQGDDEERGGGVQIKEDPDAVAWEVKHQEGEVQQQEAETSASCPIKEEKVTPVPDPSTTTLPDKEGEKEVDPLLEDTPNTEGDIKTTETDMATIETTAVYMPTAQVVLLDKSHSSPKEGSLSGDKGSAASSSDGTHKQEMDSQSNYSKVSSDITPSDIRSNEEAGSSHKESNSSVHYIKIRSPSLSPRPGFLEEEEDGMDEAEIAEQWEDMFKKLFIPLKVLVGHKVKEPSALPFWLNQAELTPKVAMTYKLPTRTLEDVLQDDLRRMENVTQSLTSKQQLLQLLNETYHKVNSTSKEVSSKLQPSSSHETHPSTSLFTSKAVPVSSSINVTGTQAANIAVAKVNVERSVVTSQDQDDSEGSADSILQGRKDSDDSKDSDEKEVITNQQPSSHLRKTLSSVEQKGEVDSSDTNSDPVASNSISDSSTPSCSSSTSVLMLEKQMSSSPSLVNPSMAARVDIDSFFHDSFHAMTSDPDALPGMSIEDLIMNKVFVADILGGNHKEIKSALSVAE
uniref:Period n=1 Tax=Tritonia tetraquetra TaxID=2780533 RepID=A0A2Z4QKB6_9GAST|nr:period [Tritonia tetraquetra]